MTVWLPTVFKLRFCAANRAKYSRTSGLFSFSLWAWHKKIIWVKTSIKIIILSIQKKSVRTLLNTVFKISGCYRKERYLIKFDIEWMNQWIREWMNEWMNEWVNYLSTQPRKLTEIVSRFFIVQNHSSSVLVSELLILSRGTLYV